MSETTTETAEAPEIQELTFHGEVEAQFRVDRSSRQISGLVLPWNLIADNGFARWRFKRGSLKWGQTSRVKLLRDHDMTNPVGVATKLEDRPDGLYGTFSVARGEEGDRVLSLAEDGVLDGFSAGPRIPPDGWEMDTQERGVRLVTDARLMETTVTAIPAFDDARVSSVKLMITTEGDSDMAGTKAAGKPAVDDNTGATVLENQDSAADRFEAELDQRFATLADKLAESQEAQAEQVANTIAAAFDAAFERLQGADAGSQGAAAAARFKVLKEPPVYRFDGDVHQPSLVRDAWRYHTDRDYDARDRLRKFQEQQTDLVKFAQTTTTTAADVIPPGYRPDLFVSQLMQGRPIVAQASRGTITDATPFTVPLFVAATGDGGTGQPTSDHTEGTNPAPGEVTLDSEVVQPGAISGIFELTREIVDSSNPAIDAIAMAAMRESWNQQTEAKAYTALNGAAVAANTETFAATDPTTGTGALYQARALLARYSFSRFAAPTGAVINQKVTEDFANANDTTGRPLLPSIGAQNTSGLGNAVQQGWFVDGLPFVPAWAMADGAGDDVAIIANSADWWVWESPLLTFRFEEKRGPAVIELALFGYYGTHVLRNAGIFAIRNT